MTLAIVLGALAGAGIVGVLHGLSAAPPSLDVIAATMNRSVRTGPVSLESEGLAMRVGRRATFWASSRTLPTHPKLKELKVVNVLTSCLAVTGEAPEQLVSQVLIAAGAGLLVPPALWIALDAVGMALPLGAPVLLAVLSVPAGIALPIASLLNRARDRRRHFRIVIGTFVDLVVLSLAGGVGIEGALFAASQVSADWAARRMARVLLSARDSGRSPWAALGVLGEEIGVPELVELTATLQLAGTEGAKIRQSLSARAVSLRRHEQADAESSANGMTERLFLPGALLLVGFLLFIGYPAFSRILGGF